MKKLWQEFKEFAFKGNMIDLAIAVVIGGAFGAVVTSLVKDILMPMLSFIHGLDNGYEKLEWHTIKIGSFIAALVNFILIALAIFVVVVKGLSLVKKRSKAPATPDEPTVKECPFCLSEIPFKASRCKYCATDQPNAAPDERRLVTPPPS
jgi:large conductance mechanosensitive channel